MTNALMRVLSEVNKEICRQPWKDEIEILKTTCRKFGLKVCVPDDSMGNTVRTVIIKGKHKMKILEKDNFGRWMFE